MWANGGERTPENKRGAAVLHNAFVAAHDGRNRAAARTRVAG